MAESLEETYRPLLEAVAFASRAHQGQVRKDRRTPYVSHVCRVCLVLSHVFGVRDVQALTAAALHDTLEDTPTDFDDLEERFGAEVARWVALLSKDGRQPDPQREAAYKAVLAAAPWQVRVCKLADIFDNLLDSQALGGEQKEKAFRRSRGYLEALRRDLPEPARPAWELVARLLEELSGRPPTDS